MSLSNKKVLSEDAGCRDANEMALLEECSAEKSRRRSSSSERKNKAVMLVVTGCIVLEFFRLALYQESLGPTLPYLRSRARSDYATVTQSISGKAIGGFFGAIVAGFLADRFKQGWGTVICITQAVSAAMMAALPFAPYVEFYWVAFVVMGFLEGAVAIFAQEVVLRMWQAKAAAPLHLLHFGFGVGSIIMPLVVSLFFPKASSSGPETAKNVQRLNGSCVELFNGTLLQPGLSTPKLPPPPGQSVNGVSYTSSATIVVDVKDAVLQISGSETPNFLSNNASEQRDLDESIVQYVFVLLAAIAALCFAAFVGLIVAEKRGCFSLPSAVDSVKTKPKLRDSVRLSSCLPHSRFKVALLLAAMFLFGVLIAAVDRTFGSFIFVYAKQELCFTDAEAVALNSAFWGAFTGGRMVGFILAHRLHPKYFFLVEISGLATCCLALAIFGGGDQALVTWIFSLGAAFFLGPLFPSFLAWSNRYINVTGMAITLVVLGTCAGYTVSVTAVGHYLDQNAGAVGYFAAGFAAALLAVTVVLQVIGSLLGDRFDDTKLQDVEGEHAEEMVECKPNGVREYCALKRELLEGPMSDQASASQSGLAQQPLLRR